MTKQEQVMLMELDFSEYRICTKCGKIKRRTDYYKGKTYCKPCRIKQMKELNESKKQF